VTEIDETEPPRPGFSANLSGATLYDLIQLQCFSGKRAVVRVTSSDEVGYLYFRGGAIVHAMSSSNVGEAAALEILSWTSGSFEPCNAGWPDADSIQSSPQALLLRAAQVADESAKSNLVPFRRSRAETPRPPRPETPPPPPPRSDPPPPDSRRVPASGMPATVRIQTAVRLDPNGTLLSSRGADGPDLAACAALATRLGNLIGDALGLERVRAVEASGAGHVTLIVVENTGNLVAVRAPASADLNTVRERYGI
jgi:hypothetical protein